MLSKEKIKQAERNVNNYLAEGMLKKEHNETAMKTYRENADTSLETAKKLMELESESYKPYLWVIVAPYYSMFYIANAVLLNLGYKTTDYHRHQVTSDALIIYVRNKLKKGLLSQYEDTKTDALELVSSRADEVITSFTLEKDKRSKFQYETEEELKKGKAVTSLQRAKEFMNEMGKLLDN